jgi:anti-sigma B factor antagonist
MHIHTPTGYEMAVALSSGGSGTDLQFRHAGGYVVFDINGPLALRWVAEELCHDVRQMIERGRKNLILDMADVPMVDSAGVGALAAVRNLIEAAGGKLVLLSAQQRVLEMLKRLRLDPFFTFSDDSTFAFAKS